MSPAFLTSLSPGLLLLIGVPLNGLAGLLSFFRRSVDAGGALAGAALGSAVFVTAGPRAWLILAAFVLSSSAFTRLGSPRKESLAAIQEKGGRRDALQVLANGGVGLLAALLLRLTRDPAWALGFAAAFASANADTWASEIGELSRGQPVSLVTLHPVPRGISGGVTLLGIVASLGGAALIAVLFALGNIPDPGGPARLAALAGLVAAAGLSGSLFDSFLGSTVQARYRTPTGDLTERRTGPGGANLLTRGIALVTNDVVNLLSTAAAAALGVLFSGLVR